MYVLLISPIYLQGPAGSLLEGVLKNQRCLDIDAALLIWIKLKVKLRFLALRSRVGLIECVTPCLDAQVIALYRPSE